MANGARQRGLKGNHMQTKKYRERQQRTMSALATIRKGDRVKIVNCLEAERYSGETFEVLSEPYQICGTWCVKIERKGTFDIGCLEKVWE